MKKTTPVAERETDMVAPLIGITCRRLATAAIEGTPAIVQDSFMYAQHHEYAVGVERAGGVPVLLPPEASPGELMRRLDGVVLSGGQDVDPARYGASPGPFASAFDGRRDAFELELAECALTADIPVLGVCRGLHILNVLLGGTLVEHLDEDECGSHRADEPPYEGIHVVSFTPGSQLHGVYGDSHLANTMHHQAIDRPGRGVQIVGWSEDGVPEAAEIQGARAIGVQWHPEFLREPDPLFGWLIREAGRARGTVRPRRRREGP